MSWLLGQGKTAWTSQAPTKSHIDLIVVAMISTSVVAATACPFANIMFFVKRPLVNIASGKARYSD